MISVVVIVVFVVAGMVVVYCDTCCGDFGGYCVHDWRRRRRRRSAAEVGSGGGCAFCHATAVSALYPPPCATLVTAQQCTPRPSLPPSLPRGPVREATDALQVGQIRRRLGGSAADVDCATGGAAAHGGASGMTAVRHRDRIARMTVGFGRCRGKGFHRSHHPPPPWQRSPPPRPKLANTISFTHDYMLSSPPYPPRPQLQPLPLQPPPLPHRWCLRATSMVPPRHSIRMPARTTASQWRPSCCCTRIRCASTGALREAS